MAVYNNIFLSSPQSPSHITSWQTRSIVQHLDISGKHSAILQLTGKEYSRSITYVQVLSHTAKYAGAR